MPFASEVAATNQAGASTGSKGAGSAGFGSLGHGDFGVVVGWKHFPIGQGIDLTVQSTAKSGSKPDQIDERHLLMTKNQALILAKYLLDVTGQSLPPPPRRGLLARWFGA
jgi:hypothetical protein